MRLRASMAVCVGLALLAGCSTNTELGGVRVPNSYPETRITGGPPTLLEASYAVPLNWTGVDPDGKVAGFQFKVSDNGVDGISPFDTLTFDPLTGAELHPWHYTTSNDTVLLVLADQADFPDDVGESNPRSFRSHTFFIRAVDDKGAVDPTPAQLSFTATTLVPSARVVYPNLGNAAVKTVPPTVNFSWSGTDDDFDLRVPTKVRFLWKDAIDALGNDIRNQNDYNNHWHEVLSFDDPSWSDWKAYAANPDDRRATFKNNADQSYHLFAVQMADTAGAVSVSLGYQKEVAHVWVRADAFRPQTTLAEPFLGVTSSSVAFSEIAGGQPLNFQWVSTAESYNGAIVSYRFGWDVVDVNDENDPGWAIAPGLTDQHLYAPERSFDLGLHTFNLRVVDDSNQVRDIAWSLRVVPFVDPEFQSPLLVVDQVVDEVDNTWMDEQGNPRNQQNYRNPYWHFLADGQGGVAGFSWELDRFDHTYAEISFADLVPYKVVLCFARSHRDQFMFQKFRPLNGNDRFVWLAPYQERGGNLFLVGNLSMDSFLEDLTNYMVPLVFNNPLEIYIKDGEPYIVGFGTRERPDGTEYDRGPRMYPYATAGITALDWTSPADRRIYNRSLAVRVDRAADCVGLKGVVLDAAFKGRHGIGPGVVPDTMYTNPIIDWQDAKAVREGTLQLAPGTFQFRTDEFINASIAQDPPYPIQEQMCDSARYQSVDVPDGKCIEPMFTGISRMDWMRLHFWRQGELGWPSSRYTVQQLDDGCGGLALTSYQDIPNASARTNGRVFGYFSYKMAPNKPGQAYADVYWGFDPYRFDETGTKKAIRWVLEYFGLTINQ